MANQDLHTSDPRDTYVERDRIVTTERSGGSFFIFGAIVVALLVLVWLFSMGSDEPATTTTVPATENSVTIETAPAPAAPVADGNTTVAPADDSAAAPATDSATGDATATSPAATAPADATEPSTVPGTSTAPASN